MPKSQAIHISDFKQKIIQIWPTRAIFVFSQKSFGQNGQIFFKKAPGIFFSRLQALTNCKVAKVFEKLRYRRTDKRTDGRHSLGLKQLRRKTKMQ